MVHFFLSSFVSVFFVSRVQICWFTGRWIPPEDIAKFDAKHGGEITSRAEKHGVLAGFSCEHHVNIDRNERQLLQLLPLCNVCPSRLEDELEKKLLGTSASLLVRSALLVVTMFAIRNKN